MIIIKLIKSFIYLDYKFNENFYHRNSWFLGSHLADEFLSLGHEVIGVDNLIGGDIDNLNPRISFHKVDCLDLEKLNELISGIDIVYHAACTPHEGLSVFSPAKIVNNTFQITANTLSAAIKNKVKKICSMFKYG